MISDWGSWELVGSPTGAHLVGQGALLICPLGLGFREGKKCISLCRGGGGARIQTQLYLTPKFTLMAAANEGRKSNALGIKEDGLVTKLGQELEHFPQIPAVLSHCTS